jgi:hypothetical protein
MPGGDNCNFASKSIKGSIPDTSVLIDQEDNKSSEQLDLIYQN